MALVDMDTVAGLLTDVAETEILPRWRNLADADIRAKTGPNDLVTVADEESEKVLTRRLMEILPGSVVVGEEGVAANPALMDLLGGSDPVWIVDPVDGTKEFINKRDDFTVNIGLISNGKPVLGVLLTPVDGVLSAGALGLGAWEEAADGTRTPISVRKSDPDGLVVVGSLSHRNPELEAYIASLTVARSVSRGSALKFTLVARGEADVYPRTGPTMEWDTAAGHAVLLAAGGSMTTFDGAPFLYGKPDFHNGYFIAKGL